MWFILGLLTIIFNIIAISDILRSPRDMGTKVVVIALILFIPFVGAGVYLLLFRYKGY